jgi:hypothetical protein
VCVCVYVHLLLHLLLALSFSELHGINHSFLCRLRAVSIVNSNASQRWVCALV